MTIMGNKIQKIFIGTNQVRPNQQRSLSKSNNSEEIKKSEIETLNVEIDKDKIENTNNTWSVTELKK